MRPDVTSFTASAARVAPNAVASSASSGRRLARSPPARLTVASTRATVAD